MKVEVDRDVADKIDRALRILHNLSMAITPHGYKANGPSEQQLDIIDRELRMLEQIMRPILNPMYVMQVPSEESEKAIDNLLKEHKYSAW